MADQNELKAEVRTQFGKGAARKLRAAHKIPAVIYGHGTEPRHVTLPGHETSLLLRKANALINLDIEGDSQLALVKDVQKDPVKQLVEHIDLVVIRRGEKVTVDVPVHLEGESAAGTIAALDAQTLSLEVLATNIPENVVVSIEGLAEGTHVTAGDVTLPEGATLQTDPDVLVVGITTPAAPSTDDAAGETEAGESTDEAAAAEGDADAPAETQE